MICFHQWYLITGVCRCSRQLLERREFLCRPHRTSHRELAGLLSRSNKQFSVCIYTCTEVFKHVSIHINKTPQALCAAPSTTFHSEDCEHQCSALQEPSSVFMYHQIWNRVTIYQFSQSISARSLHQQQKGRNAGPENTSSTL